MKFYSIFHTFYDKAVVISGFLFYGQEGTHLKIPIKEYLRLLSRYLKPLLPKVVLLGFLLVLSIGLQLVSPLIIRYFIDNVTTGGVGENLIYAALFYIGIAAIQQVVAVLATYVSQDVGWKSTNQLRLELVEHCMNLDMSFHKEHQSGELIQRVDGDVTALFEFFSKFSVNLLTNVGLIIGVVVLLFGIDWRLGIVLTVYCLIIFFIFGRIQKVSVPFNLKEREINAKFFGFLGEQIACTEDVRSNGASLNVMNNFYNILRKWSPANIRSKMMNYSTWMTAEAVSQIGNFTGLGLGAYLWSQNIISVGSIYIVFKYIDLLIRPLNQIRRQFQDLQNAGSSIIRIRELLNIKSKIADGFGGRLPEGALSVHLEDISFDYEEGVQVIKDVSVKIPKGGVLGILGRTGSGKTTLARLLVRFYDVRKGQIKLGDEAIDKVPVKELREHIAYVTQEVQLFKATVRDNLTFFNSSITDEVIMKAAKDIGLKPWLDSMPQGLDTVLDSGGGGLSAGEAQLLAFVRVFLRNPGLVILDEASSRLDPVTEHLIEKAIDKLLCGRTAIIIAHRLKTIQRADDILILENGSILEQGKRVELSKDKDSHFYHLLQSGIEEVLA